MANNSSNIIPVKLTLRKIPTLKLHKIATEPTTDTRPQKSFDFNAEVNLKRIWNNLPCPSPGKNLLSTGIIKNTKRMRFQTKTILLDDDE